MSNAPVGTRRYGEDRYIDAVLSVLRNKQAYTEISASTERHLKVNNLLLVEVIEQLRTLNQNMLLLVNDDIDQATGQAMPGEIIIDLVGKPEEPRIEDVERLKPAEVPVVEPLAEKPEDMPMPTPQKQSYGDMAKGPALPGIPAPPPPDILSVGEKLPKSMFGKIPRHAPSKASKDVTSALGSSE